MFGRVVFFASQPASSFLFIIEKVGLQNVIPHRVRFIGMLMAIAEISRLATARETRLAGETMFAPSARVGREKSRVTVRSSSRFRVTTRFCAG